MPQRPDLRKLILKITLCSAALILIALTLTPKASLQTNANVAATNAARVSNARPTPRRSPRASSNAASVEYPPTPAPAPLSTIRGRVYYADTGRAVKRCMVMLMRDDGSGGPGGAPSAITDGEGAFQMKKVAAGTYYAMVNAPGVVSPLAYADFSKSNEREGLRDAYAYFDKIVVDGVTDLDVQIGAQRGGAIGGRVTYDDGDAAIGVKVEILRKVGDKFFGVVPNFSAIVSAIASGGGGYQTDDRGVYRFAGLPPGDYIIKVTESATHGDNSEKRYDDPFEMGMGSYSLLTFFYPDALDTDSAQMISVQLGQELESINLVIPSRGLYTAEGRVVNRRDRSPVRARITLNPVKNREIYSLFNRFGERTGIPTMTDENGNWKFKELPKGEYSVLIEPLEGEYRGDLGGYSVNANVRVDANAPPKPKLAKKFDRLTIEDRDLAEMVFELGYGAILSGTATVENSAEMPRYVSVSAVNEKGETVASGGVSNYGDYEEAPRPSKPLHDFRLEAVSEGKIYLAAFVGDEDYYIKSLTLDGTDLFNSPLELKEGDTLRNVRVVLGKDPGTLRVVVLDENKEPVRNAAFSVVPTDRAGYMNPSRHRRATTGPQGDVGITLPPGEYAVVFNEPAAAGKTREELFKWYAEAVPGAPTVKIEAGKAETLTVKKKDSKN
ncbi:MAG: carboxypeptidase regulatory-like domain-containing protein [Acidobacteria bacterium]|nr:carboxypeptidase regulatory-like domain-containing protein [Acidobacteriota bacterium]